MANFNKEQRLTAPPLCLTEPDDSIAFGPVPGLIPACPG